MNKQFWKSMWEDKSYLCSQVAILMVCLIVMTFCSLEPRIKVGFTMGYVFGSPLGYYIFKYKK